MASKYVDLASGSDSNNGDSWATAYLTVAYAETNTSSGDTIFVKGTPASPFTTYPFKENRTYIGYNGVIENTLGGVPDRTVIDFNGIANLTSDSITTSSVNYSGGVAVVAGFEFKNLNTTALSNLNIYSPFFQVTAMSGGYKRFIDCTFHDMVFGGTTDFALIGGLFGVRGNLNNWYIECERCIGYNLAKTATSGTKVGYLISLSYQYVGSTSDYVGFRIKNSVFDFNNTSFVGGLTKLRGIAGTYTAGGSATYPYAGFQFVKSVFLNTTSGTMVDIDTQLKFYDLNDYTNKSTIWAGNWSFVGRGHFTTAPTTTGTVPLPVNTADPQFADAQDTLGLGRKYKVMNPDYVGVGADTGSGDYADPANY